VKRESTGIPKVDEMLEGGFPASSIIGISGPPGVGKSIFALHFLLEGARNNQKCVYVNLEEPLSNINNLINEFKFGKEFTKFVKSGKIVIKCYNYSEFENIYSDFFLKVNEEKVQRLVIDSFNVFFTSTFSSKEIPTEININKMINKAISILRKDDLTTVLILEKHKDNYNVPYLVDGMIEFDFLDLGMIERRLFVSKMRWTNQYKESVPFEITEKGIVLNDEK
jgi:KaiC/GvpD/RAD55 family RecA-like ATPase